MKYIIYTFLIVIVCGLNAGLAPFISVYGQAPNLLFLLAVVFALDKSNLDFLFVAFFAGLFLDFYSGTLVGGFTFSLVLIALLVNYVIQNYVAFELNLKYVSLVLIPSQALLFLCFFGYHWLTFRLHVASFDLSRQNLSTHFLISLFYNLLFLYPIYILVSYVKSFLAKYVVREYKIR